MLHHHLIAAACLALASCALPNDLEPEDLGEAEEPLDEPDVPEPAEPAASSDNFLPDLEPDAMLNGVVYDEDTAVLVFNTVHAYVCSGTLVRNDIVLTARHCVTDDGLFNGDVAGAGELVVLQDGSGESFMGSSSVDDVWAHEGIATGSWPIWNPDPMAGQTIDVALVHLEDPLSIDGNLDGESVEMMHSPASTNPDNDLVGDAVLCMGFGEQACGAGADTLRAGFSVVEGIDSSNGHIDYEYCSSWPSSTSASTPGQRLASTHGFDRGP